MRTLCLPLEECQDWWWELWVLKYQQTNKQTKKSRWTKHAREQTRPLPWCSAASVSISCVATTGSRWGVKPAVLLLKCTSDVHLDMCELQSFALCLRRRHSARLGCNQWLFKSLWPFYGHRQSAHSPLTPRHQQGYFPPTFPGPCRIFSFFGIVLWKP